jgi:putative glutamine amidotransferase
MTTRPLVALTTSFQERAGSHRKPAVVVYRAYLDACERLGLTTVLLSPAHPRESVLALLEPCAGLVLTGGGDVDPGYYGEEPRAELDDVLPARDEREFTALGFALERGLPVLGICRGIQVLNVHLGGTLWQDIEADTPERLRHPQSPGWEDRAHDVEIAPDSKLREILGSGAIRANSFHHQSIRTPAPGLRVTGRSGDGLIEAVELSSHPWCVAVQWHPERGEAGAPADDPDRRLFTAFGKAVRAFQAGREPRS